MRREKNEENSLRIRRISAQEADGLWMKRTRAAWLQRDINNDGRTPGMIRLESARWLSELCEQLANIRKDCAA